MSLENQRLVTVTIDWPGLGKLGVFEVRTGGNATSENTDYAPGGMAPRRQLGGQQTTEDVTVNRVLIRERDRPLIGALMASRGVADMHVSDSLLDRSKNPYGKPVTWHGIVGEVHYPDADSGSNDPARLEIVMNAHGGISA
jgi:hypothetical protein